MSTAKQTLGEINDAAFFNPELVKSGATWDERMQAGAKAVSTSVLDALRTDIESLAADCHCGNLDETSVYRLIEARKETA